ncbi:AraC family transcriptional regulator [Acinetobacter sp. MB5]|uniref:AraC family transcriptional regulator n=1 Tax=Acinetobacter sp. MB5 TaxID=2069438 RepID=UPI000DD0D7D3|nr:helix-turn-helix transcriptional regulator [Acinetobacter sp. MB5]
MKKRLAANLQEMTPYNEVPANRWIRFVDTQLGVSYKEHRHRWGEFIYVFQGTLEIKVAGISYVVPPSYAIWLPPYTEHGSLNWGEMSHSVFYIEQQDCMHMPNNTCILMTTPLIRALLQHLRQNPPDFPLTEENRHLLLVLSEQLKHADVIDSYLPTTSHTALAELLDYLQAHPACTDSLAELADRVHMTEKTLTRYSQKELGMSLHEWKQRMKLMHAIKMLEQGCTVESIALSVGYSTPTAFINMFKKRMHYSPNQFRQLVQA